MQYTNYKKIFTLAALCLAAGAGVLSFNTRSEAQVAPQMRTYLASKPATDWVVMAQRALGAETSSTNFLKTLDGQTANDYSTYILAITALGQDPRTFGSVDLVAGLRSKASGAHIGEASLLNDDIFAVLALRAAGVPTSDSLIQSEIAYIKAQQRQSGSWDYAANSQNDSIDYTAMGIMALLSAGVPQTDASIAKAVAFLSANQRSDGGFPIGPSEPSSNSASTAWALSAIHALGDSPSFWSKNNATPATYLNARIQPSGYVAFNATDSSESPFTPPMTAYAAIALAGKFYPIATTPSAPTISLRVEGSSATLCNSTVAARTAMDAVRAGATACGYTYIIEEKPFGPYLAAIGADRERDQVGWSYIVNTTRPQVGATNFTLAPGDAVVWFFGAWNDTLTRLEDVPTTTALGATSRVRALKYNFSSSSWAAALGATIHHNGTTLTADGSGFAVVAWNRAGENELWVSGSGLIRSAKSRTVVSGEGMSKNLGLGVTVEAPAPPPQQNSEPEQGGTPPASNNPAPQQPAPPQIVFGVSGDLEFGALKPAASATKTATIQNQSTIPLAITASVNGSPLFRDNLRLDNATPASWSKNIGVSQSTPVAVGLSVPVSFSERGRLQGSLIFWANPQD